jgi:hypothetical protein
VLAAVPKGHAEMVAAAIRTIFAQPSPRHVRGQPEVIAAMLGRQFPKVEAMLREANDDITAFASFPVSHWKKIWSTNPRLVKPTSTNLHALDGCSPPAGRDRGQVQRPGDRLDAHRAWLLRRAAA